MTATRRACPLAALRLLAGSSPAVLRHRRRDGARVERLL
jgi:hypothetical protein